eukprot:SAG31_NODE_610_length_13564_cov_3.189528_2_plen_186_part_00
MQPAETWPCVEVICCDKTDDETVQSVSMALEATGKTAVVLKRPVPGFLFNRLQHALLHEAYYLIESGICTAADVDKFCKMAFGPRMCISGAIEQKDLSGLVTHASSQKNIVPELHHGAKPIEFVQRLPKQGRLGAASGKGFYDWSGIDLDVVKDRYRVQSQRLLDMLSEEGPRLQLPLADEKARL